MPKISVVMPAYNTEEKFLREAIESVLSQTFTDFEFLIINDGSTNNSEDIILSYKDSRILYIKNEQNIGLIKTLNKGFDLAKGQYIARMDSDDISLPERFEKQVEFLDKNPDIDILGTWFKCFPKNRVVETYSNDKEIKECLLINSNNIGHPTVMLRKSTVDKFNIRYDEKDLYVEDYSLWLSLIDKVKFANIPEILLNYRIHKNSVCQTKEIEQSFNVHKVMVAAQGKFFGIESKNVLNSIDRLKNGQNIHSAELLAINDFSNQVNTIVSKSKFICNYDINKTFYKYAIKKCKKDILFLKLLWTSELNKILRLHLDFKIINSLGFINFCSNKKFDYHVSAPKISAVMALYNTPYSLLKATIESILSQTLSDFELIVIDDASTFAYKNFFADFKDERIKYSRLEKNSGPGYARNIGIKKASGEYVAIVDSDDVYMSKRFEIQSDFLDQNPDISLLSCSFKQSNNGKISHVIKDNDDIKIAMLFNSPLANPAVMFRKNVFAKNNLFYSEKINFAEDYELWIDSLFAGIKMANLEDILMIYTRRKNQLSRTKCKEQASILKSLYKKIFSHLKMDVSQSEIDLHYNIYLENFNSVTIENVHIWFDKIIEHNKNIQILDEQRLIDKKNQTIEKITKVKNRLFKVKIGENNFCIYKPFNIAIEKRD